MQRTWYGLYCFLVWGLMLAGGVCVATAQEPWDSARGRLCFERWIHSAMERLNAFDGGLDFNVRKPWRINEYGRLEGNPAYGPTPAGPPDNFWQYGDNKYRYMWDYWHEPSGVWRLPEWRAAAVPHLREYVQYCLTARDR